MKEEIIKHEAPQIVKIDTVELSIDLNDTKSVELSIIDTYQTDIYSEMYMKHKVIMLKNAIAKIYSIRKLSIKNEKELNNDVVLLLSEINKSDKLKKWSIHHIIIALEQGAISPKDVDNLNTISVRKMMDWINNFIEYRAKVIIKHQQKLDQIEEEKKALSQVDEKRIKYLNQIIAFYNSGDWKEENEIGLKKIYFNTFQKMYESDEKANAFIQSVIKEATAKNSEIKEIGIYTKDYFIQSTALDLLFSAFEKHNKKLYLTPENVIKSK